MAASLSGGDVTSSLLTPDTPIISKEGSAEVSKKSTLGASTPKEKIVLFGLWDLTNASETTQAVVLVSGSLLCSLGFAYLQERVFLVPGFRYHGLMTLLTTSTYVVCAGIERQFTGDTQRKASYRDYTFLSFMTMTGMLATNWALLYLNYPARIMMKSSKVVPVMIVGMVVQGRYYSRLEYFSAFLLAAGITLFTLGDAYESPRFDVRGLFLISIGVFADAVTANLEESKFFHELKCNSAEVVFYTSLFGALWSLLNFIGTGEIFPAIEYVSETPSVVVMTVAFAVLGYMSVIFIMTLIKRFGATNTEIVKSCRKVFSIVLSFIAFGKSIGTLHLIGGLLFTLSVVLGVQIKHRNAAAKREKLRLQKDGGGQREEFVGGGGV